MQQSRSPVALPQAIALRTSGADQDARWDSQSFEKPQLQK